MIWVIFAAMMAVALALLLVPMLRAKAKPSAARLDYDLVVYQDQLAEIGRDLERGVLTADQAEAARTEVQRRILVAAEAGREAVGTSPRRTATVAVVIALAAPAIAFGLYGLLGSPAVPDMPADGRKGQMAQVQQQAAMFKGMVDQLAAKLEQNPNDGKGWAMMARSQRVLGNPEKAREAYAKAMALMPADPQVRLDYASMMLDEIPEGGALPPEFIEVMREVLALDGENTDALYFLGVAEAQNGNAAQARALWTKLLSKIPEGSDDRAELQRQIDALK